MTPGIPASVRLLVVGLNHKTAPLAVRETLAFSKDTLTAALTRCKQTFPHAEVVILSTCNRVELYLARPIGAPPTLDELMEFLSSFHRLPVQDFHQHLYHHEDRQMVEHLFSVTSSLDSMVIGETQILAQVKQAYQGACEAATVGTVFHALFQRALAAAKNVHEQTNLASGRISIASVAVDLARSVFDRFDDKNVLCIGAGKMSTLVLRHLSELTPQSIHVTNRSPERAVTLASQFKATPRPMEELEALLVEADIILTSTGSPEPIIRAAQFKALLRPRRYRPVVIVDIAVPRDVEAEVGRLSNVYLYNVDDLEQVAAGNRDKRDLQIDRSRSLLGEHVEEFIGWFAARDVGPVVKALYAQANGFGQAELELFLAKHPEMTAADRQDVEKLVHRVVAKLLHTPVAQITHRTQASARPTLTAALKKLFQLEQSTEEPAKPPATAGSGGCKTEEKRET